MRLRHLTLAALATVIGGLSALSPLAAQNGSFLQADKLGYTGQVRRFANPLDAIAGVNATGTFAVGQRDVSIFAIDNNPAFSGSPFPASAFYFGTFFTPPGSPSNTNNGFVDIRDDDGGSVTSTFAGWMNAGRTHFRYQVQGGPTIPGCPAYTVGMPQDCSALWAGTAGNGPVTFGTAGTFLNYNFSLDATGLTSAVWNPLYGVYESISEPGAFSGSFSGVFVNTNTDDLSLNGFYRVDLTLNMTSWSAINDPVLRRSTFGSANVVPEPMTLALLVPGVLAIAGYRARRKI